MIVNGIYWQSTKPMSERVQDAAEAYLKKFGVKPSVAYTNPKNLSDHQLDVAGVTVRPMREIAPNILWIGVNEVAQQLENQSAAVLAKVIEAVEAL